MHDDRDAEFAKLEERCALAETQCRVYELERERTHWALSVRMGGDDQSSRQSAQEKLNLTLAELKRARIELDGLRARPRVQAAPIPEIA